MESAETRLHPSKDPRHSIAAFARLVAELAEPFGDRSAALARAGLDESDWNRVQSAWRERMLSDPTAIAIFEQTFVAARIAAAVGEESTDDARLLGPRQAYRGDAAAADLSARGADANETLPITRPIGEALPFQPGEFRPLPSLGRPRDRRRADEDPDATRLPVSKGEDTLPFVKGLPDASKGPKASR